MAMKFRAHDTFFIRKGWLNKGMRCVSKKPDVFVDKNENPMDVLGLGANMVKSLRYWLQVVGLTSEPNYGKRNQKLTEFGKTIFENDRYFEEIGTIYLLQYELCTKKEEATAWYFFFNEFSMSEFTKEDFVESLQKYILINEGENHYAIRSLNDDFSCIINTYLPRYKINPSKVSPENNIDCPLGELGLVEVLNKKKKIYKKHTPLPKSIDPWIALAVIVDNAGDRQEISLNELLSAPCNIGRVYNLDSIALLDVLYRIEKLGKIRINRTAGLDVINITERMSYLDCVVMYYKAIESQ